MLSNSQGAEARTLTDIGGATGHGLLSRLTSAVSTPGE